jgi:3'-phosphoadenosine 5'-phosphosulfate sulfotransferase (PAPS reductase)/FAD synthetase
MLPNVLSLGAGVQSSTVFLMSCLGQLPKFTCAVFADTGWEPQAVYTHLEWLKSMGEQYGIPIHLVKKGNLKEDLLRSTIRDGKRWVSIPLYTLDEQGKKGAIRRQCTKEYKLDPITKFLREQILGLSKGQHSPRTPQLNVFMGISSDEGRRMRMPQEPWKNHVYPLCNWPDLYLDQPYSRQDCLAWMTHHFPDHPPPRSACLGCPYHSDQEWKQIKDTSPYEWAETVQVDHAIRSIGRGESQKFQTDSYLHNACQPLDEVELDPHKNQLSLFSEECLGICGV